MKRNNTQQPAILKPGDEETFILVEGDPTRVQQNIFEEAPREPELKDILRLLMKAFNKIYVAVKYQVFKLWTKYIKGRDIPYLRLAVLLLFAYVVFQKDMQLQFDLKSPLAMFGDDEDRANNSPAKAKKIAWGGDNGNPFAPASPNMLKDKATVEYINHFSNVAVTEMKKFGVPASIKMAQALIESRAGGSTLAVKNNNHFGMKCFAKSCGKGHCSNFNDDHHKDFFRKYDSAWESWRAHSELVAKGRYAHLQDYGKDYEKWAHGLKKAGYATDKKYAEKLIAMIKKYELDKLDKL